MANDNRPLLMLNLSGEAGSVFVVIGAARALLSGRSLEQFNTEIGTATLVEVGTTYTDVLAIQNASFEEWRHDAPAKWLYNTKAGWVKPVPGRTAGNTALEIGGNRDNREWVQCRTRETQDIRVAPGSRISLSFWAKKTQEGKHPERSKYVEVFFHDGFQWVWGFGQNVTNSGDWAQYETEWWTVPVTVQKVSVGAVVYKDGAFQVDDVALRMRMDK